MYEDIVAEFLIRESSIEKFPLHIKHSFMFSSSIWHVILKALLLRPLLLSCNKNCIYFLQYRLSQWRRIVVVLCTRHLPSKDAAVTRHRSMVSKPCMVG